MTWRVPCCDDPIESPPIVVGSSVFMLIPEGKLQAHAVNDGRLLWEAPSNGRFGRASCAPAAAGDLILVGWDNVHAFRTA